MKPQPLWRRLLAGLELIAILSASAALAIAAIVLILSADPHLARSVFGYGFTVAFLILSASAGLGWLLSRKETQ